MVSVLRLVSAAGVALALFGTGSIVGVTYQQNLDECVSGTALHVTTLTVAESKYSPAEIVQFSSISPVEQRIFLKAFTDEHHTSATYGNWSPTWFDDVQAIAYREKQYELQLAVVDCGPSSGLLSRVSTEIAYW